MVLPVLAEKKTLFWLKTAKKSQPKTQNTAMKTTIEDLKNGGKTIHCGHTIVKMNPMKVGKYLSWRLSWKVGKQGFRRTITDETKAIEEAQRIAKSIAVGEGEKSTLGGADIVYFRECQKKLGSTPLHIAIDFYFKYHRKPDVEAKTFKEVSEEFLEHMKKQKRLAGKKEKGDRYLQTLRTHINTWQSAFGNLEIQSIHAKQIGEQLTEAWMDTYSLKSKKNLLATFGSIIRWAQLEGYISKDHIETKKVKLPEVPLKTPETFTPEELMRIFIAIPAEIIPYYAIMAFGGGRRSELEKTPMENLNLEDKRIFISPEVAKKNAGRRLKIQKNLDLWLKEFAKYDGKLARSTRATAPAKYKKRFDELGVKWINNGLRHSFCTYYVTLTDDLELTSRIAGNSKAMLDKHYTANNVSNANAESWFSITPDAVREYAKEKGLDGLLTW